MNMTPQRAVDLNTDVQELKTTLEILYSLLLSYGDDYALASDENIRLNMFARPDHHSCLFAAIDDYAAKARKQVADLDDKTSAILEESKQQSA